MAPTTITRRDLLRGAAAVGTLGAAAGLGGPAAAAPARQDTGRPWAGREGPDVLLDWLDVVFDQVRSERCSPPSAARIYGAVAVAGWEAVVAGAPGRRSLAGQLHDLRRPPRPRGAALDWSAAVNAAVATVADAAFADRSDAARAVLADHARRVEQDLLRHDRGGRVTRGIRHGRAVGAVVARWIGSDGHAESRGLAYDPPTGPDRWVRTPPNFGDPIEPHWELVRPFALPSADACTPPPPAPFSVVVGSSFHDQAMAVVAAARDLTEQQRDTAMYWRDNPDGVTGLPAGHWMQIAAGQASRRNLVDAAELLALVGATIADAFASCWVEKYRTNLLRPVTYIQRHVDPTWSSFVNSPAFPEYTSGHSVGSGAAATALTRLLGDVAFVDHGASSRGYVPRTFSSFRAAADEAATSRLYGGIHYPMAIEVGLRQGEQVADLVLDRLRTR